MAGCTQICDELKAFADGELGEAERAGVRAHLDGCDSCRQELSAIERMSHELRALDEAAQAVPRPELRARILSAIPEPAVDVQGMKRPQNRPRRRWWIFTMPQLSLAGAAAIGALIAVGLYSQRPTSMQTPRSDMDNTAAPSSSAAQPTMAAKGRASVSGKAAPATAAGMPEGIAINGRDGKAALDSPTALTSSTARPPANAMTPSKIAAAPGGRREAPTVSALRDELKNRGVRFGETTSERVLAEQDVRSLALSAAKPAAPAISTPAPSSRLPAGGFGGGGAKPGAVTGQVDGNFAYRDKTLSESERMNRKKEAGPAGAAAQAGSFGAGIASKAPAPSGPPMPTLALKPENQAMNAPQEAQEMLVLTVDQLEKGAAHVTAVAKEEGGYTSPATQAGNEKGVPGLSMTVVVPRDKLEALKTRLGGAVVPVMLDRIVAAQSARAPSKDRGRQDLGLTEDLKDIEARNLQNLKQQAPNSAGQGGALQGGREESANRSFFGRGQAAAPKSKAMDESAAKRRVMGKNAATDQLSNTQGVNRMGARGAQQAPQLQQEVQLKQDAYNLHYQNNSLKKGDFGVNGVAPPYAKLLIRLRESPKAAAPGK